MIEGGVEPRTARSAELWVGTPGWPAAARFDGTGADCWIRCPEWPPRRKLARLHHWPGIDLTELATAGSLGHRQRFFGIGFQVPPSDELAQLMGSYWGSELPGNGAPDRATPLDEVLVLRQRLMALRLQLDRVHYAKFAEAYVPISAASAWRYAVERRLPLLARLGEAKTSPAALPLDLDASWTDAAHYLEGYWLHFERRYEPGRRASAVPDVWTAAGHYPSPERLLKAGCARATPGSVVEPNGIEPSTS